MQTLSATLLAAQKSGNKQPRLQVLLTKAPDSYTYSFDGTVSSRLLKVKHNRHAQSVHVLEITLDNSDKVLSGIDFRGFQAVLRRGLKTSAGNEYANSAPLTVIGQRIDSLPGRVVTVLKCIGLPDKLLRDKASAAYEPTSSNGNTGKTIVNAILGATLACFSHCTAYTVVWDSQDAIIDVWQPKDSYRIRKGESRFSALNKITAHTKVKWRREADGSVHMFVPTTAPSPTTEVLRPNAAGDLTELGSDPVADNYANVDEMVADEDATIVYTPEPSSILNIYYSDLYNLPSSTIGKGLISQIVVTVRAKSAFLNPTQASLKVICKTNGTVYEGDATTLTNDQSYANYTKTWTTNPKTGLAWTWTEINALQIGTSVRPTHWNGIKGGLTYVTQVFVTITYTPVDYEYALEPTQHNFFEKAYRIATISPNKIHVESMADDSPQYSGVATDATSYALDPVEDWIPQGGTRLASNAQAQSIAEAIIASKLLSAQQGSGTAPMNVGQEEFDFVLIADVRAGDSRTGNVGWIHETFNALGKTPEEIWSTTFGFGGVPGETPEELYARLDAESGGGLSRLAKKSAYIENLTADQINLTTIDQDDIQDGVTYQRVKSVAIDANGMVILDQVIEGTYGLLRASNISGGHIKLTANAVWNGKVTVLSGVTIDSSVGINIFGVDNGLTTRATETGTIQCSVNSSGQITAGAGAVTLDQNGVLLDTTSETTLLRLKNTTGGASTQSIYLNSSKQLVLGAGTPGTLIENLTIVTALNPDTDGGADLGTDSLRWGTIKVQTIGSTTYRAAVNATTVNASGDITCSGAVTTASLTIGSSVGMLLGLFGVLYLSSAADLQINAISGANADAYMTANRDVILTPNYGGGGGNVKFGTYTTLGAEALAGYITIKDSGGTVRKLAVIA